MTRKKRAFLQLLLGALLFSAGGAGVKIASFSGQQTAGLRSGIAALTILLLLSASRSGWRRSTWAVGLAYAVTVVGFVHANKLTTAAAAIYLQGTAPLWVALLSRWLVPTEARGRRDLPSILAIALGLLVLLLSADAPGTYARNPWLGNLVAVLSGLAYALTLVGLRVAERRSSAEAHGSSRSDPAASAVVCGNLLALAFCLPAIVAGEPPITDGGASDWAAVGFLGVCQLGLGYVLVVRGLRHAGAFEASLILLLEPLLGPVWAYLLQGEIPGVGSGVGGGLIILGTLLGLRGGAFSLRKA